jgi:hypothetical protein
LPQEYRELYDEIYSDLTGLAREFVLFERDFSLNTTGQAAALGDLCSWGLVFLGFASGATGWRRLQRSIARTIVSERPK